MTLRDFAVAGAGALACLATAACVAPTHQEDAAMRGARPTDLPYVAAPPAKAITPFPSLGGDILAGTSPETLARARAAQGEALTQALGKP